MHTRAVAWLVIPLRGRVFAVIDSWRVATLVAQVRPSTVLPMSSTRFVRLARGAGVRTRPLARLLALQTIAACGIFITGCNGSVPMPSADISSGQAMMDLGNALVQLREETAMIQAQVDSLRDVVAYQDSIVRQLAAVSNIPVRPSSSPVY